ncbi:MAG: ACT domain-containing protein [Bacteroidetes bacterium]|nr:ACT domain-containing protein [Bacteroidota bacterium]
MTPTGQTNLNELLKSMKPKLQAGQFVFCVVEDVSSVNPNDIIMTFREDEGNTLIIKKETADQIHLSYSFVASWITLTVHSSLAAVGLTAAFSKALADEGISCNVVAAFYHDHIFVDKKDAEHALAILTELSERS